MALTNGTKMQLVKWQIWELFTDLFVQLGSRISALLAVMEKIDVHIKGPYGHWKSSVGHSGRGVRV